MLQKRFPSLHSILQDKTWNRIGLARFGADFQEKFIPHWLFIALASNFSVARESWSGMDCVSPIKLSGPMEGSSLIAPDNFLAGSAGNVNCKPFTSVLTKYSVSTPPGGQGLFPSLDV